MVRVIKETSPTASKIHNCMACPFLMEGLVDFIDELSFSNKKSIVLMLRHEKRIQKGDKYLKQTIVCEGEIDTFIAIPAIHQICVDFDLYP